MNSRSIPAVCRGMAVVQPHSAPEMEQRMPTFPATFLIDSIGMSEWYTYSTKFRPLRSRSRIERVEAKLLDYMTLRPPSTIRFCPVIYELASEQRKRIAPWYSSL